MSRCVVDTGVFARSLIFIIVVALPANLPLLEKVRVLFAEKFVVKLAFENLLCCVSLRLSGFTIGLTANSRLVGERVV